MSVVIPLTSYWKRAKTRIHSETLKESMLWYSPNSNFLLHSVLTFDMLLFCIPTSSHFLTVYLFFFKYSFYIFVVLFYLCIRLTPDNRHEVNFADTYFFFAFQRAVTKFFIWNLQKGILNMLHPHFRNSFCIKDLHI